MQRQRTTFWDRCARETHRIWDLYFLPALLAYGQAQMWRSSVSGVLWEREHADPRR